ncbi:MAG: hypothetical protein CM15mP47_3160 [Methanobacteriota archaeon]|nr:MAG: hypothetical protein CM15mP47_3160 [Euryarchaeota archaeon]
MVALIPTEIPFIAMSRDAGDIFEALVINATEPASIELIIDVKMMRNAQYMSLR